MAATKINIATAGKGKVSEENVNKAGALTAGGETNYTTGDYDVDVQNLDMQEDLDALSADQPGGDPYSKQTETYSQEDVLVLEKSIEKQVAAMGRATREALRKQPLRKVTIPIDKINPHDTSVLVGLNGFNLQIKRNVPVVLPQPIIDLLVIGGYSPM